MDPRQAEYLQLVQERNKLKKQIKSKSKQELELEARERGFSVNFSGANSDRFKTEEGKPTSIVTSTRISDKKSARNEEDLNVSPRDRLILRSGSDADMNTESPDSQPRRGWANRPPQKILGVEILPKNSEAQNLSPPVIISEEPEHVTKNINFKNTLDNMLKRSLSTSSESVNMTYKHKQNDMNFNSSPIKSVNSISNINSTPLRESVDQTSSAYTPNLSNEKETNMKDEEDGETYEEDFEETRSDQDWSESMAAWHKQNEEKKRILMSAKSINDSSLEDALKHRIKHISEGPIKLSRESSIDVASSMDSTVSSESGSNKLTSILDKTYNKSSLPPAAKSKSTKKRSLRHSKQLSPHIETTENKNDGINTLVDLINGNSVDMNQSLMRKLMSLDPQQKAIILAALQPIADQKNLDPVANTAQVKENVIYDDEIALNIRVKILSTWVKSKTGSLSAVILRSIDSNGTSGTANYLSSLQSKVLSGSEYLPPSSEAVRFLNQVVITTLPQQKIFPRDLKTTWKAPIAPEKPIELSFHGNIAIRSDQSSIPISDTTTADDLLDYFELVIVNGWGAQSCKDIDVYVGFRCVWSGEMPDTSMYNDDRLNTMKFPTLISDAIASEDIWTKKIVGLGRKNFVQRKKSISISETPQTLNASSHQHDPNKPIWLESQLNSDTFNANSSLRKSHDKKVKSNENPIWLQGRSENNAFKSDLNRKPGIALTPPKLTSGGLDSSLSSGSSASKVKSRRREKKQEDDQLRQSLEALSAADRSNLGRLNANSSSNTETTSTPTKQNDNNIVTPTIDSSPAVSGVPTNVLRRRAKRIQEVNQTVQSTVQGLAHVFSNTNIVLKPARVSQATSSASLTPPAEIDYLSDNDSVKQVYSIDPSPSKDSMSSTVSLSVLPKGRVLVIEIYSTWGDEHYMGLNGIDIFDAKGHIIQGRSVVLEPGAQSNSSDNYSRVMSITANPPDINILPDYGHDPRVVSNLLDGTNFTKNDLHMWLAPIGYFKPQANSQPQIGSRLPIGTITITFSNLTSLSMLRIFNYNKSRTHIQRGVRECKILFDGVAIFEGEIRMATGDLVSADTCSEVVIFTLDDYILRPIAEYDESAGYYTKDLSDEWLKNLRKKQRQTRPSTAEKDKILQSSTISTKLSAPQQPLSAAAPVATPQPESKPKDLVLQKINPPVPSADSSNKVVTVSTSGDTNKNFQENEQRHLTVKSSFKEPEESLNIDDVINDLSTALGTKISPDKTALGLPKPPKPLTKAATFMVSNPKASQQPVDLKALATPIPGLITTSSSSVECRRITLNLLSTWGDHNYIGLSGIEILTQVQGKILPISLSYHNIEHVEPRDLSAIGCHDDPRIPENLLNGINDITDDRFMWMIPYTPKGSHFIQFDLKERKNVVGIRVWNYNKPEDALLRGVRELSIEIDGQLLGQWTCRIGTGFDGIPSSQTIYFHEVMKNSTLPAIALGANNSSRYIRYITPATKQDYEPQVLPSGLMWTFTLLENWGDDYFVGLDKIEFIDSTGKVIDFLAAGAEIVASPHSLRDLQGYENDNRIPQNLLRSEMISANDQAKTPSESSKKIDSWLAPISHSMVASERKSCILRTAVRPPSHQQSAARLHTLQTFSPNNQHNLMLSRIYESYYDALLNENDIEDDTLYVPRENKVWITFRYPVHVAAIRIFNYSKTPTRGVKELSIYLDGQLVYLGSLQQATQTPTSATGFKPHSIVFTNDPKIVRTEKDLISFCGSVEQDVLYINERQVMVRSKDMYTRKPSVASEGVYVDVKNRPTTSLHV